MSILDFVLLGLLGFFVLAGFWFGLIHMIGSLLGLVLGAIVAGRFYLPVADWLSNFMDSASLAKAVGFFLVFVLTVRLAGLVFWLVERILKVVTVLPFVSTFNRLLGAALGFVEGMIAIGVGIWFIARLPWSSVFTNLLQESLFAEVFLNAGQLLAWLMPVALKTAQSII